MSLMHQDESIPIFHSTLSEGNEGGKRAEENPPAWRLRPDHFSQESIMKISTDTEASWTFLSDHCQHAAQHTHIQNPHSEAAYSYIQQ